MAARGKLCPSHLSSLELYRCIYIFRRTLWKKSAAKVETLDTLSPTLTLISTSTSTEALLTSHTPSLNISYLGFLFSFLFVWSLLKVPETLHKIWSNEFLVLLSKVSALFLHLALPSSYLQCRERQFQRRDRSWWTVSRSRSTWCKKCLAAIGWCQGSCKKTFQNLLKDHHVTLWWSSYKVTITSKKALTRWQGRA